MDAQLLRDTVFPKGVAYWSVMTWCPPGSMGTRHGTGTAGITGGICVINCKQHVAPTLLMVCCVILITCLLVDHITNHSVYKQVVFPAATSRGCQSVRNVYYCNQIHSLLCSCIAYLKSMKKKIKISPKVLLALPANMLIGVCWWYMAVFCCERFSFFFAVCPYLKHRTAGHFLDSWWEWHVCLFVPYITVTINIKVPGESCVKVSNCCLVLH